MNSRDAAEVKLIQASAMGERDHLQARDPATTGARVMVAVRRSILPAGRPGAVESVSLLDVSFPINCAGPVTGAGGFFARVRRSICKSP
jgi:hypothetical protein